MTGSLPMKSPPEPRKHACEAFFRLAWLWCGDADRAMNLTEAAATAAGRERDPDHWAADLFRAGRARLLEAGPCAASDPVTNAALALAEPGRSALLMHCSGVLSDGAMEHVVELRRKPFSDALKTALAGAATGTGRTSREVEQHLENAIWQSEPPPEIQKRLHEAGTRAEEANCPLPWFRQPVFLAVAIGFLTILFVVGWMLMGSGNFSGSEEVMKIAAIPQREAKEHFDAVEVPAGELGDWFTMKGFSRFRVAPGFESLNAVGVRLFRHEDTQVAVVAVPVNDQNVFFYVFEAAPLGIEVGKPGHWEIIETKNNVLAIEERDGVCFMIVTEGDRADMDALLEKYSKS